MNVPFSYLDRQFADPDPILEDIRSLVQSGMFTLGPPVEEFERRFAAAVGLAHSIGVASGTDALMLALKVAGVEPGDEVITTPMTFIATVGAIAMIGARPVFADSTDGFVIDPAKVEAAITPTTRAIVPVHYTGNAADMPAIAEIARRCNLAVVEDACQAIGAAIDGRPVGSWGVAAAFSLHPLKNLNVWGDGGLVATSSEEVAARLRLLRNHGLVGRDEVAVFGHNSRLHTVQAAVGLRMVDQVDALNARRIAIAQRYDRAFGRIDEIRVPPRRPGVRHVFHLYVVQARDRDRLVAHLATAGVEAKVHYPVPVHLQPAARHLGYGLGSFPVCEEQCRSVVTLPAHPYLTEDEVEYTVEQVARFYGRS